MTVEEYRVVEESYGQIAYEAAWANELHKGLSWASAFPNVREIWNRIAAAVIQEYEQRRPQPGLVGRLTGPVTVTFPEPDRSRANALADECQRLKDESTRLHAELSRMQRGKR